MSTRLRLFDWVWGGYHQKVSDEMTIGGVPPNFHKPWFINPGLTLLLLVHQVMFVIITY